MKRLMFALVLTMAFSAVAQAEDTPWFDMENCSMCSNMLGVVENVQWENHVVANGMLTVTMVPAEHAAAWAEVEKKMESVGQKLMTGEQMYLCNFCQSMGGLMMSGASHEMLESGIANAKISLITSTDAKVVERIQAHAKRTIEEYNKMMAADSD